MSVILIPEPLDWDSHAVMAVDPGEYHSPDGHGYAVLRGKPGKMHLWKQGCGSREDVLRVKREVAAAELNLALVVEQLTAFGPSSPALFNTAESIGAYRMAWGSFLEVKRPEVKAHWLGRSNGKDSEIWGAMQERFGQAGSKREPGVLYGVKGHARAALALAVLAADQLQGDCGLAKKPANAFATAKVSA